jgi:2,5-diamino-6-(ribosylamino)-4(3H)-pyrimidinone 5'-phosphate reductase
MTEYERTGAIFGADAWSCGRVTMEAYAGRARIPAHDIPKSIPRTDFIAMPKASSFAIALDPSGKLTWKSGDISGDHVVAVLSERVPATYLAFLRTKGISYIFGGKKDLDLRRILEKLRRQLGIERLLLEGGGKINGAFLAASLIDELSVLVTPIADGGIGAPSLFDSRWGKGPARHLKLVSVRKRAGSLLWLLYQVRS